MTDAKIIWLTHWCITFFPWRQHGIFFDSNYDVADLKNFLDWYPGPLLEKGEKAPHWQNHAYATNCLLWSNLVTLFLSSQPIAPAFIFFLQQETNLSFPDLELLQNILEFSLALNATVHLSSMLKSLPTQNIYFCENILFEVHYFRSFFLYCIVLT